MYTWMKPGGEDDEAPTERAKYEGNYKDGLKCGVGKMTFPNGDIYQGEWLDNKVLLHIFFLYVSKHTYADARRGQLHI